jgi:HEAT repeat protein
VSRELLDSPARRADRDAKDAATAYRTLAAISAVSDPRRARAYYAEATRLDPVDIDGLLSRLISQEPKVFEPATTTLIELGRDAVPKLTHALVHPMPIMRSNAAVVLRIGPAAADAVAALAINLQDHDRNVRVQTVWALTEIGPNASDAIPALTAGLQREADPEIRMAEALALGRIGAASSPSIPQLVSALSDGDDGVRHNAAAAISMIGPDASGAVPALISVVNGENLAVKFDFVLQMNAILALGKIGPNAVGAIPTLVKIIEQRDHWPRGITINALRAIGEIGAMSAHVTEVVQAASTDNDLKIQEAALDVLTALSRQ